MDRNWMSKNRGSHEYKLGVAQFLDFAFRHSSEDGQILCPCKNCANCVMQTYEDARTHLICDGFLKGYTQWVCHGEDLQNYCRDESLFPTNSLHQNIAGQNCRTPNFINDPHDDIQGLLTDIMAGEMGMGAIEGEEELNEDEQNPSLEKEHEVGSNGSNFSAFLQDLNRELYPGCKTYSKLSYLLHLYHLKCLNGWSQKSFSMLLELQSKAFPEGVSLPKSFYEAKKIIRSLGLHYEKFNACTNDCSLFWGEKLNDKFCRNCKMPWWKVDATKDINYDYENDLTSMKKQPAKIMRYFPIIPRLKRIFASEKTAVDIRWHDECRKKDGLLRHPADGLAWKDFDSRYPDFASDSRNVRLALATDGFNPFKTMSTSYSTWPVVLVIYNFPPWVCMKQSSFMLSMIIPGDKSPGNDIDIYFPPLIDELKKLWEGVEVYDTSKNETFKLRGALTSMIHDFPAYANMSGWSTKGQYACPVCMDSTDGLWLKHSRKWSYMGHRRWLPSEHQFRMEETFFNGNEETRRAPFRLTGSDVVKQLDGVEIKFGKSTSQQRKRNRQRDDVTGEGPNRAKKWWKKKSIFFELPYWEHNMLRHNLDVMHIEKNVCDNIIDTLLGHSKKSKDNLKARLDLVEMGIRNQLHPQILRDGRQKIPPSCLTLSNDEKGVLLQILHDMKAPDGYSSNISRCINLKQRKMSGLKSHDCHVLLEDLLPVALRYCGIFDEVVAVITDLSNFFKIICSKILDLTELDKIQERVVITLCRMERIFLPSFFTIMVHLIVHLVEEVKIGGPVQYRWMYPFERYFVTLKSFVKNTARPESSIAEGYIAEECLTFCSRYLGDVETVFNRPLRNPEPLPDTIKDLFSSGGYPIGASIHYELTETEMIQIQRYVLRHCDGVDRFKSEFVELEKKKRRRSIRLTEIEKDRLLNEEFPKWFKRKMMKCGDPSIDEHIFNLSIGPMIIAKKYNGFAINGIRFHTVNRERNRKTQSSGVVNNTEDSGVSYYGRITDIIEVNYHDSFKVVLFKCEWVDVHHNSARYGVFYISDCRDTNWCTAIKVYPRDRYDMVEREATDIFNDQINHNLLLQHDKDVPRWLRTDIDAEVVEGR